MTPLERRVSRLKKGETLRLCAFCGEVVPHGPAHPDYTLDEPGGASITFYWHVDCALVDETHTQLADMDAEDPESDGHGERLAHVVLNIRNAIKSRHGAAGLRGAMRIRRDVEGPLTLRGHQWGLLTRR